jgi:prepilin-type processing-associated H-X9-DG protein
LIEMLAVLAILTFLLAILMPGLARARGQARSAVCQSNIRQVALANGLYAYDAGGTYCPGAADFLENLNRWHGKRGAVNEPFDPSRGPLVPYLGPEGAIRQCPSFEPDLVGFEAGNGGYGYNNAFIGVRIAEPQSDVFEVVDDRAGARTDHVSSPTETVMFADAAFVSAGLIEYSFAEPRFHPQFGTRADPSIHFRHHRLANVAWCDGHVTAEWRTFTWSSGFYRGEPDHFDIGWFGKADDNRLFDLK